MALRGIATQQSHQIKSFGANMKNRLKHYMYPSANRASSGASLVSLHICSVTLEPSSVYKNHKVYAY